MMRIFPLCAVLLYSSLAFADCTPSFMAAEVVTRPPSTASTTSYAAADFNRDLRMDFVAVADTLLVATQTASGTYTTSSYALAPQFDRPNISIADLTGDGAPEIIASKPGQIAVYRNDGTGSFTALASQSVSTGSLLRAPEFTDVNGDGKVDMVSASSISSQGLQVYAGNGDGTFITTPSGPQTTVAYISVSLTDFNGDGRTDALALALDNSRIDIYRGTGQAFVFLTTVPMLSTIAPFVLTGDFNGDGRPDVLTGGLGRYRVLLNDGNGHLIDTPVLPTINTVVTNRAFLGDINGDRKTDIIFFTGLDTFYNLGNGDGTFSTTQTSSPRGFVPVFAADMNGDSLTDWIYAYDSGFPSSTTLGRIYLTHCTTHRRATRH